MTAISGLTAGSPIRAKAVWMAAEATFVRGETGARFDQEVDRLGMRLQGARRRFADRGLRIGDARECHGSYQRRERGIRLRGPEGLYFVDLDVDDVLSTSRAWI